MKNLQLPNQDIITLDEFKQEKLVPKSTPIGMDTKFTRSGSGLYLPVHLKKDKPL